MEEWNDIDWSAVGGSAVSVAQQGGVPVNTNDPAPSNPDGDKWWEGQNISGYADSLATLWGAFSGKPKGPETVVYQTNGGKDEKDKGMSTGALVGIIVGVVVLFIVILVLAFRRSKAK